MIDMKISGFQVTLRLPANFDFKYTKEFQRCYRRHEPGTTFQVDFQNVASIDSSVLGMLLAMRTHFGNDKADIHLTHCRPHVLKIFLTAKFDSFFKIFPSMDTK
ncbi:MAG: STAS domain-containing protein [Magnetococcales bacterium]|nr:STAS domain-containing protein [Magnetococcales bacterium]